MAAQEELLRPQPPQQKPRAIILREDAQTDPAFGKTPQQRSVEEHLELGIVNLDKPAGPTSHQISAWVKEILKAKKAGHSGTLDPDVSGVLPIGLNRATRSLYSLLPAGKEYVGVMHLHSEAKPEKLAEVIKMFTGKTIMQKPPVRSAVRRVFRPRTIYSLEVLEVDGRDVLFYTKVQAGTYIRKLCHDIGTYLTGAHMAELRRTKAGPYGEKESVTLHDLADAYAVWKEDGGDEKLLKKTVLPVESAAELLPKIWVKDGAIEALCQGANLAAVGISKFSEGIQKGDLLAVFSLKGEFVALGNAMMDSVQMASEKRGWAADTKRVVMPAGTYPKMWKTSGQKQNSGKTI